MTLYLELNRKILKFNTALKYGKEESKKAQADSVTPTNWHEFLRIAKSKVEFFQFNSKHTFISRYGY